MIRLIIAVLLFTAKCSYSGALSLDCQFQLFQFPAIGNIYSCIENHLYNESGKVTDVSGKHMTGKSNADVRALRIFSRRMSEFPVNVETFFPKIKVLNFGDNAITQINNSHLLPFPELEYLSLWNNRITSLDSNLFAGLNLIRYINFEFNRIVHIGHDLILPNYGEINFYGNVCVSKLATTADEIAYLRFLLTVNCPPTIEHIENSLENRANLLTSVSGKVSQMEERMSYLTKRLDCLEMYYVNGMHLVPTTDDTSRLRDDNNYFWSCCLYGYC